MFKGSQGSGINNIKVDCCEVQVNCTPRFKEEIVFQYDNRLGESNYTETYSVVYGMRSETTYSSAGSQGSDIRYSFGVTASAILKFLNLKVQAGVEGSEESATSWALSRITESSQVETFGRTIVVPAGVMVQIWQPVLTCGSFRVQNKSVRRVDIPLDQTGSGRNLEELEAEIRSLSADLRLANERASTCSPTSSREAETYDDDIDVPDWLQSFLTVLL
jgi:hypothetical protein